MRAIVCLLACSALFGGTADAQRSPASDETACNKAIAIAERHHAMTPRVLGTIAQVESGRSVGQKLVPWPWAINVEGVGHFYTSKAEAIAAVEAFRAAGLRSIDVGCMQINLVAHPLAFSTLDDAFDPAINTSYAARFLRTLTQQTGRLAAAMTAYHSQTPEFAADYARRLLAIWPGAAEIGLTVEPTPLLPLPPSPYSPAFAAQMARNRTVPQSRKVIPVSQLGGVSLRGGSWPSSSKVSRLPD